MRRGSQASSGFEALAAALAIMSIEPSSAIEEESAAALPRQWWINHAGSDRAAIDGSYLWSRRAARGGAGNPSQHNITRLIPGDVLYSCAHATLSAIGVVLERARSMAHPEAGARPAGSPAAVGWLVPVRFVELKQPLRPKEHMPVLAPLLPREHAPLRPSGTPNRRVALAALPLPLATRLRRLLNGQVEDAEAQVAMELDGRLAERAVEEQLWERGDISPRERRALLSARIGQGVFRERLEAIESACRVTGILDRRYLKATHIKPWKLASEREMLDGCNGLLLSPHMQHLFERGQISFADDGRLLVSRHLNPYVIRAWGLEHPAPPRPFAPEQCVYLDYHRRCIFEKLSGGRRAIEGP